MDRFAVYAGSGHFKMTRENEKKMDRMTDLIKKGLTVQPWETMATILRKRSDDLELKLLGVLAKSSVGRYKADPIIWKGSTPGEVINVVQTNREGSNMVKTVKTRI